MALRKFSNNVTRKDILGHMTSDQKNILKYFMDFHLSQKNLKIRPTVTESKTTSSCSNSFFRKKSPLTVFFILPITSNALLVHEIVFVNYLAW